MTATRFLHGPRVPEVAALPTAADHAGRMLRTATGLFLSNGYEWIELAAYSALAAPANTVAPVASGSTTVGGTLSVTNGTWTGYPAPTFSYQWQLDTVDIPGATANTFDTVDAGSHRCVVTATNSEGNASQASNAVDVTEGGGTPATLGDQGSGGAGNWPTSADRGLMTKVTLAESGTFTQFNMRLRSASTGVGDRFKGLIYAADGADNEPGTLLAVSAPTGPTTGGAELLTAAVADIVIGPQDLWIGYVCDGGSGSGSETDSGGTATNVTIMLNSGETDYASPNDPCGNWPGSPGPYSNIPALWFDYTA